MNGIENENGAPVRCGEWELVQEIGRGAYGVVYRAVGPGGVQAAVKVCRRGDVGDERCARELRGARLYRSIPPQEGLVRMRELVEADWGFYTVMDLADDEFGDAPERSAGYRPKTLARVIEGEKALPLKACVGLALSLAKGLAALQRHHLLHRDIKPGNVVYVGGKPVLSDPGLLVEASDAATLVGTPGYVPPERFTEAASDVYSLGLTLKAASFGRQVEELDKGPALEADTGAAFFSAWWRILNKATEATPSRRYQSAKALLKDLKVLRLKIEIASMLGSRSKKVMLLAVGVLVVAFVVPEFCSLMRFKSDTERMVTEAEREAQWSIMEGFPLDITLFELPFKREKDIRDVIARVAVTNKVRATELQSQLDKCLEDHKKADELLQQISALHKRSEAKLRKGQNDDEEFHQAEKLQKKRSDLIKKCEAIYEKLPSAYNL